MSDELKARAAALFRGSSLEARSTAMTEYLAEKRATLDNMARLKAARLARQNEAPIPQPAAKRRNRR